MELDFTRSRESPRVHFAPRLQFYGSGARDCLSVYSCGGGYLLPCLLSSPSLQQPFGRGEILQYSSTVSQRRGKCCARRSIVNMVLSN